MNKLTNDFWTHQQKQKITGVSNKFLSFNPQKITIKSNQSKYEKNSDYLLDYAGHLEENNNLKSLFCSSNQIVLVMQKLVNSIQEFVKPGLTEEEVQKQKKKFYLFVAGST